MSINKVLLIGHLGAKPELKNLESGQAVCTFSIATNEKWTDKDNKKQERTEWHRIVTWGKTAENCEKYLDKGRQVYVEGRLQTRSWDDKDSGEKKYMTEVVAMIVQFLGSGNGAGRRDTGPEESYSPPPPSSSNIPDEDIPF